MSKVPSLPERPEVPTSVVVTGTLGTVAALMTFAVAGVLSGLGLFILSMISMNAAAVVGSSILFAVSLAVFISCYFWLTA